MNIMIRLGLQLLALILLLSRMYAVDCALIIGVSEYPNLSSRELGLHYCGKDADEVARFFKSAQGGGLEDENVFVLTGPKATLAQFSTTVGKLQSRADIGRLSIYFSGHILESKSGKKMICFRDTIEASLDLPAVDAISVDAFTQLFTQVNSRQQILFMDACHSGEYTGRKGKDVQAAMNKAWQESSDEERAKGIIRIGIVSSKANEESSEDPNLKNGIFTHFLLEGLKRYAADSSGRVYSGALQNYVTHEVPIYCLEHGFPAQNPSTTKDFEQGLLLAVTENVSWPKADDGEKLIMRVERATIVPTKAASTVPEVPEIVAEKRDDVDNSESPRTRKTRTARPVPPKVDSDELFLEEGQAVDYYISASGKPTLYGADNLPSGLRLDKDTGRIYGRIRSVGSRTTTVQLNAQNDVGDGWGTLKIKVTPKENDDNWGPNVSYTFSIGNQLYSTFTDGSITDSIGNRVGEVWQPAFQNSVAQLHFYSSGCFQLMSDGRIYSFQQFGYQTIWALRGYLRGNR